MLMPASDEFIALCRSQISLLTQGLGASLSVVYLTEELTEVWDAKLVPIVAHPEVAASWEANQLLAMLTRGRSNLALPNALDSSNSVLSPYSPVLGEADRPQSTAETVEDLLAQQQIILPLVHEGMVMGLLVTARSDRSWQGSERAQVERIARSLAIACGLDQRAQWLSHDLQQQQRLRKQQQDIFHDLLHQFRNPLTALKTFGKLLLRRMGADSENHPVAEGIVRESDRLQELLKQFDAAIDLGESDLMPLLHSADRPVNWEAQIDREAVEAGLKPMPLLPSANFLTGSALQVEPHLVSEVLKPLVNSAAAIAQDRQLELQVDLPDNLPPVLVDVKALREVLSNLLDNALKYTPAAGRVYVQVGQHRSSEQGCFQAIVIADTGVGIPSEDQARLFERHYRGVQAKTDIPGTGLGLAIARDLLVQMRGEIQVFSPANRNGLLRLEEQGERPGTAFVVWLLEQAGAFK